MVSKHPVVLAASSPVVSPARNATTLEEIVSNESSTCNYVPPTRFGGGNGNEEHQHPQLKHQALDEVEQGCSELKLDQLDPELDADDVYGEVYMAALYNALQVVQKRNAQMRAQINKARTLNAHLRVIKKHQQLRTAMLKVGCPRCHTHVLGHPTHGGFV